MSVRVRFAPSPTGLLHLGGARTALFNYLYATANRGQCILRIEDTDQERYVPESVEKLEESLCWLGIEFHESPSKGGPYGPYVQSERLPLYQRYAKELLQGDSGYPCFCSKERLQSLRLRGQQSGYDGMCRSLSRRQTEEKMSMGLPYTIRLKVPQDEVVAVEDEVYGRIEVGAATIEDQVLLKTDGFPTYHLACVVDDHCMNISHVLRGEEWLLSTAQHVLLYKGLGWSPPLFAHLPLLLSSTGEKLSKRKHGASVQSYRERGFLAEAVTEFLSLLGWSGRSSDEGRSSTDRDEGRSSTDHDEGRSSTDHYEGRSSTDHDEGRSSTDHDTLVELARAFSLDGLNRHAVSVDEEKLMWINKKHFRGRLQSPPLCEGLARQLRECVKDTLGPRVTCDSHTLQPDYLTEVLQLLQDRISLVPRVPVDAAYFWKAPNPSVETLNAVTNSAMILEAVCERLSKSHDFSQESLTSYLKAVSAGLEVPHKTTMQLCRVVVIGQQASPGLAGVLELLGRDTVLDRLQLAITAIK